MLFLTQQAFATVLTLYFYFIATCGVSAGNNRPYWVSITGFEGAGSVGQDAGAGGYAGRYVQY